MNLLGYRNALGEPFSGSSIRVIVSNPVYVGQVGWHTRPDKERKAHNFHDTEWKQGEQEPIWNESLWQAIKAVRARSFRGSNGGKLHNVYPFRRLAVCDRCGANLYGEAHRSSSGRQRCCTWRARRSASGTPATSEPFARHNSRTRLATWLASLVIPADWRADIERLQRREAQIQRPTVDTARIERQLANLRELFLQADITRDEYVGRKRALTASLNGGAAQPSYSEAVLVRAARLLQELGTLWSKATPTERAEIAGTCSRKSRSGTTRS